MLVVAVVDLTGVVVVGLVVVVEVVVILVVGLLARIETNYTLK